MELQCNEVKGDERAAKTTTQKLGEPVTIVITKSTEGVTTSTALPSALSEYLQPPLRDENDEAVTETLTRILRDLGLVNEFQNILKGIKETGYDIRDAVEKRSKKEPTNDLGGHSTGRKLFSMEVHQKAAEAKGPMQMFRRRTYRRRLGDGFKRYSREANEKRQFSSDSPEGDEVRENLSNEQFGYVTGRTTSKKKRRWKDYPGNWVEWVPKFEPFLEPNYQNYQF